MDREIFAQWVAEALDSLPEMFADSLENLEIVVEDWPDAEAMAEAGISRPGDLLGLYRGIPLTQRTQDYNLVTPDTISVYRMPIIRQTRTQREARALVHRVVRHEVAHYFGISDERLHELGAY